MSRRAALTGGAALLTALAVPNSAQGTGTWTPRAPIAGGPRQEHGTVALGGKVYVVGGIAPLGEGGFATTGRVEAYDPRTGRWSDAAPLPVALNHPNVAAVGGRIYVLGGLSGGETWRAVPDSFALDPRTGRWSRLAPMPGGTERGSAAVGVFGTTILLAGGMRSLAPRPGGLQDTVATVSAYDTATGRWRSLPALPAARDHAGGAVVGAAFYVLGGRDHGQDNVRGDVFAYDPRTRRWTSRTPMPTPRGGLAASAVGATVHTFGGEGNPAPGSHGVFPDTEAYDTARDRWHVLAPMPVPRHGTAAAAVGREIHLPGGGTRHGGAPVDVHDTFRASGP